MQAVQNVAHQMNCNATSTATSTQIRGNASCARQAGDGFVMVWVQGRRERSRGVHLHTQQNETAECDGAVSACAPDALRADVRTSDEDAACVDV